jgi:hypothetical protein
MKTGASLQTSFTLTKNYIFSRVRNLTILPRRPQYQYPITLIWWRGWVPLMPGVGDLANIDLT